MITPAASDARWGFVPYRSPCTFAHSSELKTPWIIAYMTATASGYSYRLLVISAAYSLLAEK